MTPAIIGWALVWVIGVVLAEQELRLRHNGYEYQICKDGKVRRFHVEEFDHESLRWTPSLLSWAVYVPYRLYRIKHPVHVPTADELSRMYGTS